MVVTVPLAKSATRTLLIVTTRLDIPPCLGVNVVPVAVGIPLYQITSCQCLQRTDKAKHRDEGRKDISDRVEVEL
jgi:hypothetical protein